MKMVIFIVGPTAIGKTEVALKLAKKINAQIISCDSMQIYKEMNIISDKPTKVQRRIIPHYLIDEASVRKSFSVADYLKKAKAAIKKIHKNGKVALVVGGSGFYMKVLLDGIFVEENKNPLIRKKLYQEAAQYSSQRLYERLKQVDQEAASKIHPNDLRRIIRALEAFVINKLPISALQKNRQGGIWGEFDIRLFGFISERDELYRRIDTRTEEMFKKGLVKEVKGLLKKRLSLTASQAIGIKEIKDYLERKCSLDEAKIKMKQASRNFAKRQLTWFRKEKRINWIRVCEDKNPSQIVNKLVELLDAR